MSGYIAAIMRAWQVRPLLVVLSVLGCASLASAQTLPTIVRVEQDWELVVGTPDPDNDAPQIVCVISPLGDVNSWYAAFELNQRSQPCFSPGGLQLQIWEGELPLSEVNSEGEALLANSAEVVRWTQSMELVDGALVFEITQGTSSTWGSFGGGGSLRLSINTTLENLNAYDPAVSVQNSGVGYATNRVHSLVLKKTRLFTSTGEQLEDNNKKVVHSQE
jgi:hypothetical protein